MTSDGSQLPCSNGVVLYFDFYRTKIHDSSGYNIPLPNKCVRALVNDYGLSDFLSSSVMVRKDQLNAFKDLDSLPF